MKDRVKTLTNEIKIEHSESVEEYLRREYILGELKS